MKKIASLLSMIMCFSACLLPTYAQVRTFTAEEAVLYALENDYNLKALETDITKAKYTVTQEKINKSQYNKMSGVEFTVSTGLAASLYKNGYMLNTAEMQLRIAERSYETAKYNLESNVYQSFYSYIGTAHKAENAKRNLETAQEQKAQAELKFSQGQITNIDLKTFEMNVKQAQNTLNALERARELSMDALKNAMSYPDEEQLNIIGTLELTEVDPVMPEEAIQKAENHVNILNLTDVYNNAKQKYTLAMQWYTSSQLDYYIEKAIMERAENDYIKNKNGVELQIKSLYNNMLTAFETLSYLEDNLGYVKNLAEIAKIQYDMGQITATDYVSYTNNVYQVESSLEDAKLNAWTSVRDYRATYTY